MATSASCPRGAATAMGRLYLPVNSDVTPNTCRTASSSANRTGGCWGISAKPWVMDHEACARGCAPWQVRQSRKRHTSPALTVSKPKSRTGIEASMM